MNVSTVLVIAGAAFLLLAVLGGQLQSVHVSIHKITNGMRVALLILSIVLMGSGIAYGIKVDEDENPKANNSAATPPASTAAVGSAPVTTGSPSTTKASPSPSPSSSERHVSVLYVDGMAHIDFDKLQVWRGDRDEDQDRTDLALNNVKLAPETFSRFALSPSKGRDACAAAIDSKEVQSISINQFRDSSICLQTASGRLVQLRFISLVAGNADHSITEVEKLTSVGVAT